MLSSISTKYVFISSLNRPYAKEMNKHYMNLGQYNNRHVIKHVTLKFKTFSTYRASERVVHHTLERC